MRIALIIGLLFAPLLAWSQTQPSNTTTPSKPIQGERTQVALCDVVAKTAEVVMTARQDGRSAELIIEQYAAIPDDGTPATSAKTKRTIAELVSSAYQIPRGSTPEARQLAIDAFKQTFQASCLKSILEPK